MATIQHTYTETTPPSAAPLGIGHHWIDSAAKKHYLSVGLDDAADWIEVGKPTVGIGLTYETPVFSLISGTTFGCVVSDSTDVAYLDMLSSLGSTAWEVTLPIVPNRAVDKYVIELHLHADIDITQGVTINAGGSANIKWRDGDLKTSVSEAAGLVTTGTIYKCTANNIGSPTQYWTIEKVGGKNGVYEVDFDASSTAIIPAGTKIAIIKEKPGGHASGDAYIYLPNSTDIDEKDINIRLMVLAGADWSIRLLSIYTNNGGSDTLAQFSSSDPFASNVYWDFNPSIGALYDLVINKANLVWTVSKIAVEGGYVYDIPRAEATAVHYASILDNALDADVYMDWMHKDINIRNQEVDGKAFNIYLPDSNNVPRHDYGFRSPINQTITISPDTPLSGSGTVNFLKLGTALISLDGGISASSVSAVLKRGMVFNLTYDEYEPLWILTTIVAGLDLLPPPGPPGSASGSTPASGSVL